MQPPPLRLVGGKAGAGGAMNSAKAGMCQSGDDGIRL